jgi:hypothetical protein
VPTWREKELDLFSFHEIGDGCSVHEESDAAERNKTDVSFYHYWHQALAP